MSSDDAPYGGKSTKAARCCPVPRLAPRPLIVWGKNDESAPLEQALLQFEMIPGAELHIFDECGHWIQMDQSARFNRIVGDFLQAGS